MKRMVKTFLVAVFFLVWSVPVFSAAASSWRDSLYRNFSCGEFKSFPPANKPIDFDHIDYPLLNAAIFFATNCVRIKHGMHPLIHSVELEKAAFVHSKDMVEDDFFSHENPYEPQKGSPFERMASVGVVGGCIAENIAMDFGIRYISGAAVIPPQNGEEVFRDPGTGRALSCHTYNSLAATFVEDWMHSPNHRANILNRSLKYLGSGAFHYHNQAFYGMDTFKATQDFASQVPD
jgi:uncharacterized protein YkwD